MVDKTDLNTEGLQKLVRRIVTKGMNKAGVFLVGEVRKSINVGVRQGLRGDKTVTRSKPGEPPRKDSVRLFRSITHDVDQKGKSEVRVRIGSNVPYGRRLELGFQGTDSLGRVINQAPRPFLRPAIANNRDDILKLIASAGTERLRT